MSDPHYVGICSRCGYPLHTKEHWTNLLLHKDCYELNLAEVIARREQEAIKNASSQS